MSYATVFEPRPTSYFKAMKIAKEEIKKEQPNWARGKKTLQSCNREEFLLFLRQANITRRTKN